MNTMPQSDNPIFTVKAKSLYPRVLLSIKNINGKVFSVNAAEGL